jgi:iron complex transport system ATP-binding protein
MIQATNLTKRYGHSVVLDDVSVTIPHGGMTAIIGPNGAGKSTLLGIMSRLLTPDAGHVSMDGMRVDQTPGEMLARRLAVLRQDNHIMLRLTVRDLVAFGRYPHSHGRLSLADRDLIDQAIHQLDLDALADRYLDELSGGQRQRAFIAMVLAQGTDYILLDEPLSSLDVQKSVQMLRLFRTAADELSRTIVIVVHDIAFASNYADRIIAMRDGRIHADGTPEEVIRSEVLEEIYGVPIGVHVIDGRRLLSFP